MHYRNRCNVDIFSAGNVETASRIGASDRSGDRRFECEQRPEASDLFLQHLMALGLAVTKYNFKLAANSGVVN